MDKYRKSRNSKRYFKFINYYWSLVVGHEIKNNKRFWDVKIFVKKKNLKSEGKYIYRCKGRVRN